MRTFGFMLLISLAINCFASDAVNMDGVALSNVQQLDMARYLPDHNLTQLALENGEFTAVWKDQSSGFARGIALMLADPSPGVAQNSVTGLFNHLSDYGWTTMNVTLRHLTIPLAQPAESELSDQENPTLDGYALPGKAFQGLEASDPGYHKAMTDQVTERMTAAWQWAQQQPGYFMFVCQGRTCSWLMRAIHEGSVNEPDVLIMLSAHSPEDEFNQTLSQHVTAAQFPVLELFQQIDSPWVTSQIQQRRKLARKQFKTDYRQRQLFSAVDYQSQQLRTVKEVYGFLHTYGM